MTTAAASATAPAPATPPPPPASAVPPPPEAKSLNALLHLPAEMELSQIELIYRAEGNANLVLALPQFKKVLRLPKMISSSTSSSSSSRSRCCQPASTDQPEGQQPSVSDPSEASSSKAGALTMPDFMAYIEIMRRLLGNEFVCAADIVAIPKESDRCWINEHIRQHRPVSRLDKEFVGPFGLLLPDVTQLPATFDVLLANLQAKDMNMDTDMDADICSSSSSRSRSCTTSSSCGVSRLGDTYAIEIKPKQGWLQLPSDVSDLFDLMPTGEGTMDPTCEPEPQPEPQAEPEPEPKPVKANESTATKKVRPTVDTLLKPDKCRCRYCSMQVVKLHLGKIKRLGQYCPLHLFSGAPGRMLDALNSLFACPQNNLRVFQSGNLIYGDHANSISCEQLHTQLFPGEIMALIKHLLVACLLREYSQEEKKEEQQEQAANESHSHVAAAAAAAFGKSTFKRCGMKTKPTATIEIGRAKHVENQQYLEQEQPREEASIVDFVKAVGGQPQRRAAAAETASPRYTKRTKMTTTAKATKTTTATTTTATTMPANVATRIAMETETEAETTSTALATLNPAPQLVASPLAPCETQAGISQAEIFHLPKNCVLQKILHLQLLVKRHFHYMWAQGYARQGTPSYKALRALLASCQQDNVQELAAEQAYMLGATALDCSIMLTFQEVQCQAKHHSALQPWLISLQGRQFLTKLSVLDLDPKPDSHFHKYIKQTRQIEKFCGALN
ncbi:PREDICTED: inositol-pentakisphosphate 2-kinase isoform X1 [Drosophila arizonae]|uniref:inositol-pentakisphosphate 2-kinase n=1 Tax=Drosophila arizonae TaxID=7263 RepID=A0ABM1PMA2_DROAR|nr:PREDICTED: inositol-pentakisphosphate 2-kinase isoform X1 [Drosophila arizonae]